jgi:hypothetical protein
MYWFSEGELIGEILRLRRGIWCWFWYRDVLRQAEGRGFVRITAHTDEKPFWWRSFGESVEMLSDKLKEKAAEDDKERAGSHEGRGAQED